MTYALIKNNAVVSIEILDANQATALASQYDHVMDVSSISPPPQIGWTLSNGVLSGPAPVASWRITKLAMRQRFTLAEIIGMEAASIGTSQTALTLQAIQGNLNVATYIDLLRADTQQAVGALVAFGIITQDRATTILTTPPTALELYQG